MECCGIKYTLPGSLECKYSTTLHCSLKGSVNSCWYIKSTTGERQNSKKTFLNCNNSLEVLPFTDD